jgi:hypothetical protein
MEDYALRVAISASGTCRNNRILKLADDQVTFRYTASDTGKTRNVTCWLARFPIGEVHLTPSSSTWLFRHLS